LLVSPITRSLVSTNCSLGVTLHPKRNKPLGYAARTPSPDEHRAIGNNGFPDKVVIDKSGANLAGPLNMNCLLILNGWY